MNAGLENAVIRMGDIKTMIDMVDSFLSESNTEQVERAVYILREVFAERYNGLKRSLYGGEQNG